MVPFIKDNFKNMYKNELSCSDCLTGESSSIAHAKVCPSWSQLRSEKNMQKLEDVAEYFLGILREKKC